MCGFPRFFRWRTFKHSEQFIVIFRIVQIHFVCVDTITNKVILAEPENVSILKIKLTDCYGRVLQTFGNFSFTLEMQEVVSSKLYSAYKDNLAK